MCENYCYYARRAIYLSAFGQTPNNQGEWYNYRLDRIQHLKALNWSDSRIPEVLLNHYPNKLPTPEYIKEEISAAWGYDFYQQSRYLFMIKTILTDKFETALVYATRLHATQTTKATAEAALAAAFQGQFWQMRHAVHPSTSVRKGNQPTFRRAYLFAV